MIHIGGKSYFNKQQLDNSIRHTNDINAEYSTFLSLDEFYDSAQSDVKVNFLVHTGITHSIKTYIRTFSKIPKLRKLTNCLLEKTYTCINL